MIETYLNYKNKNLEIIQKEYESNVNDYRDINEEEMEKYINEKLSQIPNHDLLKRIKLDDYGILMLCHYIKALCGIKNQYIHELKRGMLLQRI